MKRALSGAVRLVLATIDPSLFKAAVEQAQANPGEAHAEVDRLRASESIADVTLGRDRTLAATTARSRN
jgi:multidrug resistance efflux pump